MEEPLPVPQDVGRGVLGVAGRAHAAVVPQAAEVKVEAVLDQSFDITGFSLSGVVPPPGEVRPGAG